MGILGVGTLPTGARWKANQPIGINGDTTVGLTCWYQFNTGITVSGAGVSQWDDQSGNGNHLLQSTDTNRPAKQSDGSILFDGIDNYLKANAFTIVQPETIYILFKQITWTDIDYIFDGDTINTGVLFQTTTTPTLSIHTNATVAANTDLALDTYGVATIVFSGASSLLQINNETPTTGNASGDSLDGFTLGARGDAAAKFSNIQVKEVIIYNVSHDQAQRAKVINYLMGVGGIK